VTPSLSVVLPYWLDRPALEAVEIARNADSLGYRALWIGEMMTFDAFALAAAIVRETGSMRVVVGPLAIGVRSPASMALGIASVTTLGGRRADLALGASTPLVVGGWHGRRFDEPVARMREAVDLLRQILAGERSAFDGRHESSQGFRVAGDAPRSTITVAAFGPAMLRLAARVADRVVVNLVTPRQVARTHEAIDREARAAGRPAPPLAAWIPACVDPDAAAWQQIARQLVVYVGAPGYAEMFAEAGFDGIVTLARSGAHPREVAAALPRELAEAVGAIGDAAAVRAGLDEYAKAGANELGVVPVTAGDPGGRRLLEELART
jgi:probable F420-dependent oxidoreductase